MAYGNITGQTPQGFLKLTGGTMTGNINMNNNNITNVANGVNTNDAVNLGQVQGLINNSNLFQGVAELVEIKNGVVSSSGFITLSPNSSLNYTNCLVNINLVNPNSDYNGTYLNFPATWVRCNSSQVIIPNIAFNSNSREVIGLELVVSLLPNNNFRVYCDTYGYSIADYYYSIQFYKII